MFNKFGNLLIVFLFALFVASCETTAPNNSNSTVANSVNGAPSNEPVVAVELRQEWFPYSGFAGEVSAANRFAGEQKIALKIIPGSEEVDPIKLVLSGSAEFGVVSSDLLAAAVAKGAPLVAVGAINYKSPSVFLVRANSGIKSPTDFIGKRVGILTGTNTERVYQVMMKKAQVDRTKVKEMQVPFELQTFALGQYDVRPAFIYDETVSLEQQSIPYEVIEPGKYGVDFIGTVYFTSRDVIEKKRDVVQRVVNSLAQGWKFALENPDASIDDLTKAFPELKAERERRSLELGKPYFAGEDNKPLFVSAQRWAAMLKELENIGVIAPNSVGVQQVWDDSFVRKIYDNP